MARESKNMSYLSRLEDEISTWPNVSAHPHRFGGKEFRFGKAEIGHVHRDGTVDIPFPRAVRDALLKEGRAEEHRWVPNSGWTTFRIRGEADIDHAIELMRISYLRYAAKSGSHAPHAQ
jgi:luciferase-like monooxygenase